MKCPLLPETIDGLEGALKETELGIKGWISEPHVEEDLKGFLISYDTRVGEVLRLIPELRGRLKEDEYRRRGFNHPQQDQNNCSGSAEGSPSSSSLAGDNDADLEEEEEMEEDIVIVKEEADIDSWIPENEDEDGEQMGQEEEEVDPFEGIAEEEEEFGSFILPIPTYQVPRPLPLPVPLPPPPPPTFNNYVTTISTGFKSAHATGIMMPRVRCKYCCKQCGSGFSSRSGLGTHIRKKHENEFICHLCPYPGMRFTFAVCLEKHKLEVHGGSTKRKSKIIGSTYQHEEEPVIYQKGLDKKKKDDKRAPVLVPKKKEYKRYKINIKKKEPKEKPRPYHCAHCPRMFTYWNQLNLHIRLAHKGQGDRTWLSRGISNSEPWKLHKGFRNLEEAKSHLKSMGSYTFQSYIGSNSNWSKEFFVCKEAEGCGRKVYIEDTATEVKMFLNEKDHNHEYKSEGGDEEEIGTGTGSIKDPVSSASTSFNLYPLPQQGTSTQDEMTSSSSTRKSSRRLSSSASNEKKRFHWRGYYGDKQFQCSICGKGYLSQVTLDIHKESIHGMGGYGEEDGFKCEQCPHLTFNLKQELTEHRNLAHWETMSPCPTCGKLFANQAVVETHHKLVHAKPRKEKHPCSHCKVTFKKKFRLNRHLQVIHGIRIRSIGPCSKYFGQWKMHKVLRTREEVMDYITGNGWDEIYNTGPVQKTKVCVTHYYYCKEKKECPNRMKFVRLGKLKEFTIYVTDHAHNHETEGPILQSGLVGGGNFKSETKTNEEEDVHEDNANAS